MSRLFSFLFFFLLLLGFQHSAVKAGNNEKPNILWITCEDISPYLGSYGCKEALTPNLDRLANEGLRYTHAYANAPVCAVARSTILTGMYASTTGTHQMRSRVQLPESILAYPKILRKAGYYCTNNSKKDYNSNYQNDTTLWDESSNTAHYRNRSPSQPFFAVFNITNTHESQLHRKRISEYVAHNQIPQTPRINPAAIELPPYHPDLPVIREDWARLHDLITLMDKKAGALLSELEEEELAENTIVFFYSDHGGQLARSKRYIYNVGTQVPLIVKIPEKWKHLAPESPGNAIDRLVSFVDFPKTVLSLAGVEVPETMQGRIFLGNHVESSPDCVTFFRDRMAERYDFSRAVTDGKFYYIRNFMPDRPRGRDARYGFKVQANWGAWEDHFAEGKCNDIQSQFFRPKPVEQFFNTEKDPWHVDNLIQVEKHQKIIQKLSAKLDEWMIETKDIGLIPEPMFYDLVGEEKQFKTLYEYAQSDEYPVKRILNVAKAAGRGEKDKTGDYLKYMKDNNPIVRYWGAYGIYLTGLRSMEICSELKEMANHDTIAANRIMAAQALGICGNREQAFEILIREVNQTNRGYVLLQALNAIQFSETDDRLTLDDWKKLKNKKYDTVKGTDQTGMAMAQRIIADAIEIWPKKRKVK